MLASFALALLAGILSTLSPCVLPLLPIVLLGASSRHRFGPLALALGLAASFVVAGLFIATIGFSLGLNGEVFRKIAAVLLLALGLVMIVPSLQARLALVAAPVGGWADARLDDSRSANSSLAAQFGVGALLGLVWSPCVGPTLGAASLLAARGENLGSVAITMLLFGVGAALPLLLLGMVSRDTMIRWRGHLMQAGQTLKIALGAILIAISAAILTGVDRSIEAFLVEASPQWLTELTTRF